MASTGFSFHRNNNALIATYSPYNGIDWLKDRFTNEETISIKSTYLIRKEDLIPSYEELTDENSSHSSFQFRVAMLEKDFYKFDREMLDIPINLFFHRNIGIEPKYITLRDYPVSIFPVIAKVILEDIYIVPDDYNDLQPKNVLPISSLKNLLNDFPNSTEMTHYRNQRIDIVIGKSVVLHKQYLHYLMIMIYINIQRFRKDLKKCYMIMSSITKNSGKKQFVTYYYYFSHVMSRF
jgi:hypothetical protein